MISRKVLINLNLWWFFLQREEGLDLLALGREERAAREGATAPRERGQRERDAGPGLERSASRCQVRSIIFLIIKLQHCLQ